MHSHALTSYLGVGIFFAIVNVDKIKSGPSVCEISSKPLHIVAAANQARLAQDLAKPSKVCVHPGKDLHTICEWRFTQILVDLLFESRCRPGSTTLGISHQTVLEIGSVAVDKYNYVRIAQLCSDHLLVESTYSKRGKGIVTAFFS